MNAIGNVSSRRRILVAGGSIFVLAGCGSLIGPSSSPPQMYVLAPSWPEHAVARSLPWQLAVATPEASTGLSTDRIALRRGENFDYYADAQWTDGVPQLIQTLFVEALERGGALGSVARDDAGVHAEYILQCEIHAFDALYGATDGPPAVEVDITLRLVSVHSGVIAAAREFHNDAPAAANTIPATVTAFGAAVSAILADATAWIFDIAPRLPRA
jgi:ABC-type uncharacterized transport system auxiliary subunit